MTSIVRRREVRAAKLTIRSARGAELLVISFSKRDDVVMFDEDGSTDEVFALVLACHPQVAASLAATRGAAWQATDPVLLELCRLRLAQLFGDHVELAARTPEAVAAQLDERMVDQLRNWPRSALFGPRERSCLSFCEQFFIDVAGISASQTAAISEEIGVQGLADFVSALLVVEQRLRLRLTWTQLFFDQPANSVV